MTDMRRLARAMARTSTVLGLALCAALAGGCGHSPEPATNGAGNTPAQAAAAPGSGNDQAAANALRTTPLTEADIDLYLDVMKAAADQITHETGRDRAALNLIRQVNDGKLTGVLTPEQSGLLRRGVELRQLDDQIAVQRGEQKHYEAIRDVIEGLIGPASCGGCSADGGVEGASAEQEKEWADEEAVQHEDLKLLEPHRADIVALQKQVRGSVTNHYGTK
ncbi:MAG: hypothetical protein WBF06_13670 [Candidatus Acidiferrales bacterium]